MLKQTSTAVPEAGVPWFNRSVSVPNFFDALRFTKLPKQDVKNA
jgi:hypothetical protein